MTFVLVLVYITIINLMCCQENESATTTSVREDLAWDAKQLKQIEEVGSSRSIYPFISCQHCDTFLQCFLRCPFAEYPGLNRYFFR